MNLRPYQEEWYQKTKDLPAFAFFWKMRVGKTLPTVKTATHLFRTGKIDTVLLLAPNGVQYNWARHAIAQEMKDPEFHGKHHIFEWKSSKSGTKAYAGALAWTLNFQGLVWVCVNVEALSTNACEEFLDDLVTKRKTLLILDEGHRFKTPKSSCTKAAVRLSKKCPFRRDLTGTPSPQGPFDLWSQFHILDPMILSDNGKPMLFSAFKTRFGIWKPMRYGSGPRFLQLDVTQGEKGYRDLDQLNKLISPYCSFLTQKDVFEYLPEEAEEYIYFEMSDAQKKAYRELRDELETELASGVILTAQQAMVRVLRLQQISRGFVSIDGKVHDLGTPRPSITALLDFLAQIEGKFVIWCRFTADVDAVLNALKDEGIQALRFDGSIPASSRPGLLAQFGSDPNIRGIVGTAGAGGVGLDMSAADTMVFYSMDFSLVNWDQARSRIQNMNKTSKKLLYAYVMGRNTGDEYLLGRVRGKEDLSATISGKDIKRILQISRGKSEIVDSQNAAIADALGIFGGGEDFS